MASGDEASKIAETVLLYQRSNGGWPKNYDRKADLSEPDRRKILADRDRADTTFDNGATHTELRILGRAYSKSRDQRFLSAFRRGIEFTLAAQYPNGGWPQRFPLPRKYGRHITFNDGAMVGVLRLLRDVADGAKTLDFVDEELRKRCRTAVERGIQCILETQIIVEGKRTAWCAQHDEKTLEPRKARSYELPSLSGSESVGIVRFLMEIDKPSPTVMASIESAIAWLDDAKLTGIRQERREAPGTPKGFDKIVVRDPSAPPLWARFYEIGTNRPIFSSRDGVPKRTLAEISYERRNGYSWLGPYAAKLLSTEYPAWRRRHGREGDG